MFFAYTGQSTENLLELLYIIQPDWVIEHFAQLPNQIIAANMAWLGPIYECASTKVVFYTLLNRRPVTKVNGSSCKTFVSFPPAEVIVPRSETHYCPCIPVSIAVTNSLISVWNLTFLHSNANRVIEHVPSSFSPNGFTENGDLTLIPEKKLTL